jgi:hypothetical protein
MERLKMKAKISKPEVMNGKNYGGEKEMVSCYNVIAIDKGQIKTPITVRCYTGRSSSASTVYASIWASGKGVHVAGHGSAGGYGYHKESAAIQDAITSAGIELYGSPYSGRSEPEDLKKRCSIGGVGSTAIESALFAIARALGYRGKLEIVRN